jgi:hypothetical protein
MTTGTRAIGLAAAAAICTVGASTAWAQQKVAAVSYFSVSGNPGDWTRIRDHAPTVGLAMINPGNGTGSDSQFTGYNSLVETPKPGQKLIGYVYTQRATRNLAEVEANIDRYFTLIRSSDGTRTIDGIFLDEVTSDCGSSSISYYTSVHDYLNQHHPGAILIINPGNAVPACYLPVADIIVSYEGLGNDYTDTLVNVSDVPRTDTRNTNSAKFWHILHNDSIASSAVPGLLDKTRANFAGWVTICGSSYSALPSYWEAEIANVESSSVAVTINARDLDNGNASLSGLCIFIDGSSACAWTPVSTTLTKGTHTITATSFQNLVFNHWEDNTTSAARSVNLTANTTFNAYYHSR